MDNKSVRLVGKAISHPLKIELIRELRTGEPQSPNAWSETHNVFRSATSPITSRACTSWAS